MAAIVWKGYLSFGLVSFPVRLFAAARAETIHFHMLHKKDLSRLKEVWYCVEENRPIERSEIVKGYESGKDGYVVIADEELKKIAPATASTMDVLQFVHGAAVDPILFEKSYYLAPDEKVGKPYTLFLAALKETKCDAVARIAMHSREHTAIIRAVDEGLILHTLYYADELHAANKAGTPKTRPGSQELELAKNLVRKMVAPFKPATFRDSYRENIGRLIEQKKKGQKIEATKTPPKAPVMDLMEALKRSLKSAEPSETAAPAGHRPRASRKPAGRHRAA
jgi:DNA end-binding protein Ku